jgi:hypothetical protein
MDNQPPNPQSPTNAGPVTEPTVAPVAEPEAQPVAPAPEPPVQPVPASAPEAVAAAPSVTAPTVTVAPMQEAVTSPHAPVAPAPKRKPFLLVAVIILLLLVAAGTVFAVTANRKPAAKPAATTQTKSATAKSTTPTDAQTQTANETAKVNVHSLQADIESYWANNNGAYPGDLSPSHFPDADPAVFQMPAGTKLVYTPAPANCTTAAGNCKSYTLEAVSTADGTVIEHVSSF